MESLEEELGELFADFGLGDRRLTGNFSEDFLEETREDLAFALEKLAADNKSLFSSQPKISGVHDA